jgi:hypothetical protein
VSQGRYLYENLLGGFFWYQPLTNLPLSAEHIRVSDVPSRVEPNHCDDRNGTGTTVMTGTERCADDEHRLASGSQPQLKVCTVLRIRTPCLVHT